MKTKDMMIIAMFAALIAVLGILPAINIPGIGIPLTFQSIGYILAGCLLGRRRGGLAVLLFVVLVLCGIPMLSGGHGGIGLLFGPSGGYILSFPIIAYLIGLFTDKHLHQMNVWQLFIINGLIGAVLCNLIGGVYMAFNMHISIVNALKSVLVFIPGDLVKALLAALLTIKLRDIPTVRRFLRPVEQ